MSEDGSDYAIGYRRPPKATQFQPGKSGNSKGRPKDAKNSRTIWNEELDAKVVVLQNGKRTRISRRRAMVRQAANKAAGGDMKAIALVESVTREHEAAADNASSLCQGTLDRPADTLTMASIIERVRLALSASQDGAMAPPISHAEEEVSPPNSGEAVSSPPAQTATDADPANSISGEGSSC